MQVKTKQKTWVRRRHNIIVALAALVVYPWTKLKYMNLFFRYKNRGTGDTFLGI